MRWIGRLLLIVFALPVAIVTGTLTLLFIALFDPVLANFGGAIFQAGLEALFDALAEIEDPGFVVGSAAIGLGRLAVHVLVAPPVFIALVSEVIGARSLLWHAGTTGLLTGALPWLTRNALAPTPEETHITLMLALVGAVSGFVYWLIAGHSAGPARRLAEPPGTRETLPSRS